MRGKFLWGFWERFSSTGKKSSLSLPWLCPCLLLLWTHSAWSCCHPGTMRRRPTGSQETKSELWHYEAETRVLIDNILTDPPDDRLIIICRKQKPSYYVFYAERNGGLPQSLRDYKRQESRPGLPANREHCRTAPPGATLSALLGKGQIRTAPVWTDAPGKRQPGCDQALSRCCLNCQLQSHPVLLDTHHQQQKERPMPCLLTPRKLEPGPPQMLP